MIGHETKKRNGTYGKSKEEDAFYNFLLNKFDGYSILRQEPVKNWSIDFYISELDIYVQYNGSYFHGLDRPIEQIKQSCKQRDENIYKTYIRDVERFNYFEENNIKLVVVSDIDVKNLTSSELVSKILDIK